MNIKNKKINDEILSFLADIGIVDIHVHARDMDQITKFTIEKYRKLAAYYGVKFAAFMPNTDPTITDEKTLLRYIEIANRSNYTGVEFMIWLGLTSDPEQIKEAVRLYGKYEKYVIGLKMYAGTSTGSLGLVEEYQQRAVYKTLREQSYEGILAVHCEEDKLMYPEKYNSQKPETWMFARPEESEISSVNQNIRLAKEYKFAGWLHICHVSSHISVLAISEAKKQGMKISCGATIQHLIFDYEQMSEMNKDEALKLKCNPPIRTLFNRRNLLDDLKKGSIDLIESDFAPHTDEDKNIRNASGVNNYQYWPDLLVELRSFGFSDKRTIEILRYNPLKIFTRIKI